MSSGLEATDPITVVHVDQLKKTYRGGGLFRRGNVHALSGVSLQADAGQVFGLLGPNGAGKTTLIKILLGVIRSTGGRASLFGLPAGSSTARQRVGYLPESLRVDRHHTARSALKYYGRLSRLDSATIARRSDELLKIVGLERRDRESVKRFSKGMLQRLGLAQALMHDPDLLILDEPTDGLDPVGRSEVRRVIERLRDQGKTIFLNSHILHEVELVCSHLAIMAKGQVLATGPIAELAGGGSDSGMTFDLVYRLPDGDDTIHRQTAEQISEFATGDWVAHHGNTWQGRLTCDQQSSIDRIVDIVRGRDGSLLRLQPVRETLEDKFMRLINAAEGP
ncbi:ABC transporter ATP-binding protein [Neorhodopirellula pilleata]|uniref:Putative ABC transporter ATP-binding protein YxlF n=1 Tax=Neorhodopirellula pilleata TaxID=2714738 RepID=A0A5C6AWA9_9BACT|nr:ABC transporter ATP-binding protein [Neorhodopirellula pilleata]TWU03787.1 putative ABC transporter ATP-binding protein YxlF [Neorhodopirellula pilleata]